jgi:hypothetical protein
VGGGTWHSGQRTWDLLEFVDQVEYLILFELGVLLAQFDRLHRIDPVDHE